MKTCEDCTTVYPPELDACPNCGSENASTEESRAAKVEADAKKPVKKTSEGS